MMGLARSVETIQTRTQRLGVEIPEDYFSALGQ